MDLKFKVGDTVVVSDMEKETGKSHLDHPLRLLKDRGTIIEGRHYPLGVDGNDRDYDLRSHEDPNESPSPHYRVMIAHDDGNDHGAWFAESRLMTEAEYAEREREIVERRAREAAEHLDALRADLAAAEARAKVAAEDIARLGGAADA